MNGFAERIRRAEGRAVRNMDCKPDGRPLVAAGDGLAEQLDVRVVDVENPLVERLLGRPDGRCDRAGGRAAHASFESHRVQRNASPGTRVDKPWLAT